MGRSKKSTRKIGRHTAEIMGAALELVSRGMSIRKAAREKNLPYPTLRRYVAKKNTAEHENISLVPNYEVNRIFTQPQEVILKEYLKKCALMFYGLTTRDTRKVAYDMAIINNIKIPESWKREQLAGKEWLRSFRQRHTDLSLRKPEPCSLARATSFNRENVKTFFDNLENAVRRNPAFADGTRIFNLDETATTTVQKPQKVIAPMGRKCVGKVTSGEKGTLVTTCCIIGATGVALPPAIVFPRKHFKNHMLKGSPSGSLGLASPSGWMNSELFVEVMRHFIRHSYSSTENPSLLIFDNHESHLSIEALNLAKNSGVTILTLHPHTSAKLQPLDVGVLGPFKTCYNSAVDSWLLRNPGRPITIYDLAECIGIAYSRAMSPVNIMNAFKACGIFPYDRDIFSDIDYLPSEVTNRPYSESLPTEAVPDINAGAESFTINNEVDIEAGSSSEHPNFVSPEDFRPPLRAGPRKNVRKPRKTGKSMIATDTPEMNMIENEKNATKRKKELAEKKTVKRQIFQDEDTDVESIGSFSSHSTDDGPWNEIDDDADDPILLTRDSFKSLTRRPMEGEFVLVEFSTKKQVVHYVGKVVECRKESEEYDISFLRIKSKANEQFYVPLTEDRSFVKEEDIKCILPKPQLNGGTIRQQSSFKFDVSFSALNMR